MSLKTDTAPKMLLARAEDGDLHAQYNLGLCYLHGDGVPRSRLRATDWLEKAAAQRYRKAARRLSEMGF